MLRRLNLRDVAIVAELEVETGPGFTVLTGETGAGKSILIDALQLALGGRGDATVVREGAARAEVAAEFDTPPALHAWLDEAGFAVEPTLLLRRLIDPQGRSRAWINGSPATLAQLREAGEALVEIHGQHAWQSLTRPAAVRALLDARAGLDRAEGGGAAAESPLQRLAAAWQAWRHVLATLQQAREQGQALTRERERLAWQLAEMDKLAPQRDEWEPLNAEHQRLAHGQALLDGAQAALQALDESEPSTRALLARALDEVDAVTRYDAELQGVAQVLRDAQAQIDDAVHSLHTYLGRTDPDPDRLATLDARLAAWVTMARRWRVPPAELPTLQAQWRAELQQLDAAADLVALEVAARAAEAHYREAAAAVGRARRRAAPELSRAVTAAMQGLGMAGGRFEVALLPQEEPQAHGLEGVEFRVAGHAGSTPRPLAKVASGGELSRLALAIAVTTAHDAIGPAAPTDPSPSPAPAAKGRKGAAAANARAAEAQTAAPPPPAPDRFAQPTLIFDEIDAGVGGAVADSVGRLMKSLGRSAQVLAVTHLAQVAACADAHLVVAKQAVRGQTLSEVTPVSGETRVAEIARMLGGEHLGGTSRAHAQAMLELATREAAP
jgi:DNA repair protein RecN (Recombination protein N)